MDWEGLNVLVTGGASFIGSHLVDALVDRGARVRVVDNLSSGRTENIKKYIEAGKIEFHNENPGYGRDENCLSPCCGPRRKGLCGSASGGMLH